MENFNKYLLEIRSLDVKSNNNYLDLSHYDQKKSNYESELKRLQELALNDFLNLSDDQINRHLKRIKKVNENFKKFWSIYKEQFKRFRDGELNNTDLELSIFSLFIVDKHDAGFISEDFMFDLHDAIMFKHGFLENFNFQINDILEPQQSDKSKQEDEKATTLRDFFANDVKDETIRKLQDEFKSYVGKKMAIVIYELSRLGKIHIIHNGYKKSRKSFVNLFKQSDIKNIYGINKCLQHNHKNGNIEPKNFCTESDDLYKIIKNKIDDLI